jgi:hypothetical protein
MDTYGSVCRIKGPFGVSLKSSSNTSFLHFMQRQTSYGYLIHELSKISWSRDTMISGSLDGLWREFGWSIRFGHLMSVVPSWLRLVFGPVVPTVYGKWLSPDPDPGPHSLQFRRTSARSSTQGMCELTLGCGRFVLKTTQDSKSGICCESYARLWVN